MSLTSIAQTCFKCKDITPFSITEFEKGIIICKYCNYEHKFKVLNKNYGGKRRKNRRTRKSK